MNGKGGGGDGKRQRYHRGGGMAKTKREQEPEKEHQRAPRKKKGKRGYRARKKTNMQCSHADQQSRTGEQAQAQNQQKRPQAKGGALVKTGRNGQDGAAGKVHRPRPGGRGGGRMQKSSRGGQMDVLAEKQQAGRAEQERADSTPHARTRAEVGLGGGGPNAMGCEDENRDAPQTASARAHDDVGRGVQE